MRNYRIDFQALTDIFGFDEAVKMRNLATMYQLMEDAARRAEEQFLCPICEEDVRYVCACPENLKNGE